MTDHGVVSCAQEVSGLPEQCRVPAAPRPLSPSLGSINQLPQLRGSVEELSRCLAEMDRIDAEVRERMELLSESVRSMRACQDECRTAHEQVGALRLRRHRADPCCGGGGGVPMGTWPLRSFPTA